MALLKEVLAGLPAEARLQTIIYPEEDHFLILSKREAWSEELARWLARLRAPQIKDSRGQDRP